MKSQLLIWLKRNPNIQMISLITGAVVIGDQRFKNAHIISLARPLTVQLTPNGNTYKITFTEWMFGSDPKHNVEFERNKIMSLMKPHSLLLNLYLKQVVPQEVSKRTEPIVPTPENKPVENIENLGDGMHTELTEEEQIARAVAFMNFIKPVIH